MSFCPDHGPGRWPAADHRTLPDLKAAGWLTWAGAEPLEGDPDRHKHAAPDGREFSCRHRRGAEPHDHHPATGT